MIEIKQLYFKYESDNKNALENINITINDGDFVGIAGASGAGKTTLTYAINGIIPHHYNGDFYGEVLINGVDTVDSKPEQLALSIGSVFQDIDGQMTATIVEDEILFGLENFGVPQEEIEERIANSLKALDISALRNRKINTLSGGQKQKVAICAMLALKPKILLLDEPTGELDPQSSYQIFSLLKELNEKLGMTIIIVEQKIMLLSEFAEKLLIMNNGEVLFYDETRKVLQNSRQLEEIGINCPRVVTLARDLQDKGLYEGDYPLNISEANKMVKQILKSESQNNAKNIQLLGAESLEKPLIQFKNVSFAYDKIQTLTDVSFTINKGDFVAILGANGAGKTTVSKLFNGLLKPTSGDVLVNNMNTKTTKTSALAKHIGFLFQNPDRQICKNTVREEIMFGLKCVNDDNDYCVKQCEKTLNSLKLHGDNDPFTMSRGERQKIALASILAIEPEILILDEPTTGLDYSECMRIMEIVNKLNQQGVTVIMVTHDMEIVLDFAQKVIVMSDGKMQGAGNMRQLMKNKQLLKTAKLLPPQIAGLAMTLGNGFESVFTNEEMLDFLERSAYERLS